MVRSSLSALVIASSAVVLATSVVPFDQVTVSDAAAAPVGQSPFTARPRASQPASAAESRLLGAPAGAGTSSGAPGVGTPSAAGRAGTVGAAGDWAWAGTASGATASGRGRWRWPLEPRPTVVRPFRAPLSPYGAGHRGVDLASGDGVPVLAVEGGVVTHAGMLAGRGTVTVTHADGLRSTYEPVDPSVPTGAVVETGEVLGTLHSRDGPGHCGARACLHLGARRGPDYLDPYPLLARGRLALLPLGP